MVQHFATCPVCKHTLEITADVTIPVKVDGQRRFLYGARVTDKLPQPATGKGNGKPNGGAR